MELKQITDTIYYISNPTNVGVIQDGKTVILIDSGIDDDVGRRILRLLEEKEFHPKVIINTHSHADHCSADAYIKDKTGATIYASEVEAEIIQHPYLEPYLIYSGASPIEDLRNKFLMAKPTQVDYIIKNDIKKLTFDEVELEVFQLPGHSINQIGVKFEDTLFCADSVFSKDVLNRHKIPFNSDIDKEKETLTFLKNSNYKYYVPSHAEPTSNINALVNANFETINDIEKRIKEALSTQKTTEQIVKAVCDGYSLAVKTAQQYYLIKTGIMAHLSSLQKRGILKLDIRENTLYWKRQGS